MGGYFGSGAATPRYGAQSGSPSATVGATCPPQRRVDLSSHGASPVADRGDRAGDPGIVPTAPGSQMKNKCTAGCAADDWLLVGQAPCPSTVRPGLFVAPGRSPVRLARSASSYGPGCTQASARSATTIWAGLPSTRRESGGGSRAERRVGGRRG